MLILFKLALPYQFDEDYMNTIYAKLKEFGIKEVDISLLDYGSFGLNISFEDAAKIAKELPQIKSIREVIDDMLTSHEIISI